MNDLIEVTHAQIWVRPFDLLKDSLSLIASTCQFVLCAIPRLLSHGVIDRTDCVELGVVIGVAVALRSMGFACDRFDGKEGPIRRGRLETPFGSKSGSNHDTLVGWPIGVRYPEGVGASA